MRFADGQITAWFRNDGTTGAGLPALTETTLTYRVVCKHTAPRRSVVETLAAASIDASDALECETARLRANGITPAVGDRLTAQRGSDDPAAYEVVSVEQDSAGDTPGAGWRTRLTVVPAVDGVLPGGD